MSETKPKTFLSQKDIIEYARHRTGIPKTVARSLFNDFCDLIFVGLLKYGDVRIDRLGSFRFTINSYGAKTKFFQSRERKMVLENVLAEAESDTPLQQELDKTLARFDATRKNPKERDLSLVGKDRENKANEVRDSLIQYLKHEFPYHLDWVNPCTGESFPQSLIREKLLAYGSVDPDGYEMFYSLFSSRRDRISIAESFYYSSSSIKRRWNEAIDALLLQLAFPELHPQVAKAIYNNRREDSDD